MPSPWFLQRPPSHRAHACGRRLRHAGGQGAHAPATRDGGPALAQHDAPTSTRASGTAGGERAAARRLVSVRAASATHGGTDSGRPARGPAVFVEGGRAAAHIRPMAVISYREALNQAMREEMARDPRVFLMGEEVGQYNGAYKVTQGLLKEFGPWRVVDTPIAELGFAGVGVGAAMNGLRPVVEVMTWNFALLAVDQIVNSAAKVRQMSGGQLTAPIVFRGPQGAAHQLAAQHSQVFESMYANVPGLKVAVPATPRDAKGLLKTAIRLDDPVVFMESELLYGSKGEVEEGEILIPFGEAENRAARPRRDARRLAEDAVRRGRRRRGAREGGHRRGGDRPPHPPPVRPRRGAPVGGEDPPLRDRRGGLAVDGERRAESPTRIQRHAFDDLDAPVERVTGRDVPMPYAKPLENVVLPNAERVRQAVHEVAYRA